jgi:hypothetical protein
MSNLQKYYEQQCTCARQCIQLAVTPILTAMVAAADTIIAMLNAPIEKT